MHSREILVWLWFFVAFLFLPVMPLSPNTLTFAMYLFFVHCILHAYAVVCDSVVGQSHSRR